MVGAEFSCNSAKEHGALCNGFVSIHPFSPFKHMKQLLSSCGRFTQLRSRLFNAHHEAVESVGIKTPEQIISGRFMKSLSPGT